MPVPLTGNPRGAGVVSGAAGVDTARPLAGFRIVVAYDCLFPWTIGGAERWYRALAEGLVAAGAQVTYVTRLQWDEQPQLDGINIVAVSGPRDLYHPDGKRRADEPLRYAAGLLRWLIANRGSFDAVHLANFPYFSVLAARGALRGTAKPLYVDWHEVWPLGYWLSYGGWLLGRVGYLVQELCIRATPTALVFWDRNAQRLMEHGASSPPVVLPGLLPDYDQTGCTLRSGPDAPPFVFFFGRHIEDKGVCLLPEALQIARRSIPELRMVIAGEGVQTPIVRALVRELGLVDAVEFVGRLSDADLSDRIAAATCVAVPSIREGYGLAPVEAAAHGTPAVVAAGPENAAVDHIVDGRNGFVVPHTPQGLADGIVKTINAGSPLRTSTAQEFARMAEQNSMRRSVHQVVRMYTSALTGRGSQ